MSGLPVTQVLGVQFQRGAVSAAEVQAMGAEQAETQVLAAEGVLPTTGADGLMAAALGFYAVVVGILLNAVARRQEMNH